MRFTLAACLALTAAIAVLCYLLTAKPGALSYVLLMGITIFAPICAVAGIVYGRDNLRAFCIGALFPLALLVWSSSAQLQEISLDPAAYGWPTQGQTSQQVMVATTVDSDPYTTLTPMGSSGGMPMSPGASGMPMMVAQPWFPPYDATVSRAQAMTNPTCALSIAAILGGILVMAIRGGLKRREFVTSSTAEV